jgi:hypothetical protein
MASRKDARPPRPRAWDGSEAGHADEIKHLADREFDGRSVLPESLPWRMTVEYFARFGRWPMTAMLIWGNDLPAALVRECEAARKARGATG